MEAFELVWQRYDQLYPTFDYKQVDWTAARSTHRPAAQAARSAAELAAVVRAMLAPLRDVHAWTLAPDGASVPSYRSTAFVNWRSSVWNAELERSGVRRMPGRWGHARLLPSVNVPYLFFETWVADFPLAQFDSVLDTFRDSPALIVDVRMNGGGDSRPALDVARRFFDQAHTYEYVQFRNGPAHNDLTSMQPHAATPRGSWQFRKPVLLLVGRGCFSSTESFVLAMRSLPHVLVAGDTTGGGSANPAMYDLAGGWSVSVPRWISYDTASRPVEWAGVLPHRLVPAITADFDAGRDPLLEYAKQWALQVASAAALHETARRWLRRSSPAGAPDSRDTSRELSRRAFQSGKSHHAGKKRRPVWSASHRATHLTVRPFFQVTLKPPLGRP